jgi:hypothetical protein
MEINLKANEVSPEVTGAIFLNVEKIIEENFGLNRQKDLINASINQMEQVNAKFYRKDIESRENLLKFLELNLELQKKI